MAYAKRTCHLCGMIKPVNYMEQVTVKRKTGHASDKVTALTMLGFVGGNKASIRRVNRRLWANNKRGYVRNKQVWQCASGECHMTPAEADEYRESLPAAAEPEPLTMGETIFAFAIVGGILYGSWWVISFVYDFVKAFFAS